VYGEWIQIQTNQAVYYSSVSFAANGMNSLAGAPSYIKIVGSHDSLNWTLLQIPFENSISQGINIPTLASHSPNAVNLYNTINITSNKGAFEYIRFIITQIYYGDIVTNYVSISDMYFTASSKDIYINNGSITIGSNINPRQAIDIYNGNMIITNGNIGVGTINPMRPLHIVGTSFLNGNVGISNINPNFTLDINGDINFKGKIYNNGTNYISSQWISSNQTLSMRNTDIYILNNVGIGTTAPMSNLHVQGTSYLYNTVTCQDSVNVFGTLFTRGNIASLSDKSLKTELVIINDPLDKISKLNGYIYRRLDTNVIETGLLAQDVLQIMPELVNKDNHGLLTISYGNMAGLFVEAIKTLTEKIKHMESEIYYLKNKL